MKQMTFNQISPFCPNDSKSGLDKMRRFLQYNRLNYFDVSVKGRIFDKFNRHPGKSWMFPVRRNISIDPGDVVVIDKYCEAFPLKEALNLVDKEDLCMCEVVGVSICSLYTDQAEGSQAVLVNGSAFCRYENTTDSFKISEEDIYEACYINEYGNVTKFSDGIFAGEVCGIDDDGKIIVATCLERWEKEYYGN